MDIKNTFIEKSCVDFKNKFFNHFDWNDIDVTYSRIDICDKVIHTVSSNYDWMLTYWGDDLDLLINERLTAGVQYWNNYSQAHANALSKTNKNALKLDFCNQYGNLFEITSINSKKQLSMDDLLAIYKHRSSIADYIYTTWEQNEEIVLPLRADIALPLGSLQTIGELSIESSDIQQYMRFGNIRFSRKEVMTIRLLLSNCQISQISVIQGCSEDIENQRIQKIKDKLDCSYATDSGLFNVLKENGITLACLETLVSFS